jgi:hypothetical protein
MKISQKDSLRLAAAYADIFDYPLTWEELILWRVGVHGNAAIPAGFKRHPKSLLALRAHRERWSKPKWEVARRAAHLLRLVPGIMLAGVTGGLAMNNADKDDDIDFFCLVSRGTLWTSRLLATIILDIYGMRRKPGEENVKDKICLNMFMVEGSFAVPPGDRNLFVAHEILQMVPLWDRGGAYRKFLRENAWVKRFLPNAWGKKYQVSSIKYQEQSGNALSLLRLLEPVAKWVQLTYMRNRRTTEVITRGVLRFHPKDARPWVERKFKKRLEKLGIPIDNVFNSY